jgi:hypothetical protein
VAAFHTRAPLSRRTILRGLGASVTLPFLEAMLPGGRVRAAGIASANGMGVTAATSRTAAAKKIRLVCIEMVHGAAGSAPIGIKKNLWAPATVGRDFDLSSTSLKPLQPFRDYLTIVSNTDVDPAEPFTASEIGGDHARSSAVFLTQAHPKQTKGGDVQAGISIDQMYARMLSQETPIPSMQLCIEPVDQAGGCGLGYSCVYTDSISWASPTRPLPMIRNPRIVFDQLYDVFGGAATPEERRAYLADRRSILDWILSSATRLRKTLGASDKARLNDYLENVREIEQRIQNIEKMNLSGESRELPAAPAGVPDSFSEHVKLMFDLQALAFASDTTRVFAFKLGRDASERAYPESGCRTGFHGASHHSGKEPKIVEFAKINTYHVSLIPYFLEKLANLRDENGSLLDNTLLLYGSPMGDSNQHNHKRVPFFLVGRAGGVLPGGLHLKAANQTPLANVMLSVLQMLGVEVEKFGDSERPFDLSG